MTLLSNFSFGRIKRKLCAKILLMTILCDNRHEINAIFN